MNKVLNTTRTNHSIGRHLTEDRMPVQVNLLEEVDFNDPGIQEDIRALFVILREIPIDNDLSDRSAA
jgi:hypothetical protein